MWGFLVAVGSAIWKGLEIAGKVTLEILKWTVTQLVVGVAKLGNGLKAVGHLLMVSFKDVWGFTRKLYDDVLKPAWLHFWKWFDTFRHWLTDTFGPVLAWLRDLRDNLLLFYKTFVRPWLDLIDVTRKLLHVFSALGLAWATALDKRLAELETAIEKPFRFVLAQLNLVIGIVNRIVTVDGLLQRVALIRSLARDYQFAWRAIVSPYVNAETSDVDDETKRALRGQSLAAVSSNLQTYYRDGGGPDAGVIDEMAIQWRKYYREGLPVTTP